LFSPRSGFFVSRSSLLATPRVRATARPSGDASLSPYHSVFRTPTTHLTFQPLPNGRRAAGSIITKRTPAYVALAPSHLMTRSHASSFVPPTPPCSSLSSLSSFSTEAREPLRVASTRLDRRSDTLSTLYITATPRGLLGLPSPVRPPTGGLTPTVGLCQGKGREYPRIGERHRSNRERSSIQRRSYQERSSIQSYAFLSIRWI
jgi:hypothetical protein